MNVTDMDTELEVDAATAEAVRRRLADMVASTAVAPDAWDKISARTSAASSAGGRRRGRRRLLVAAAAVLLLAGGVVVDGEGRGGDRVDTDTTPSTIAEDEKNFDDRRTDDDADEAPDSAEDRRPESAPEADQREVDPGSPVPSADDDSESAGSAPSSGPGAGGGDPSPAPGVPGPSPAPNPTTTTTGSTTTTTVPLPPPRTPGDITIQTSSGFGVELVINDAADFWERGAFVRRTDSEYTGDPAVAGDGYSYIIGFSYTGSYPPACINMARAASPTTAPHTFAFGVMGSDIANVRVLTPAGGSLPALVTTRSFADGARGWMIEEPLKGTTGAEGLNANGEVVARYVLAEGRPTCDLATPAP
jgi:hypothetical protein